MKKYTLQTKISELNCTVKLYNILARGIKEKRMRAGEPAHIQFEPTIQNVIELSRHELKHFRNMGAKTLAELDQILKNVDRENIPFDDQITTRCLCPFCGDNYTNMYNDSLVIRGMMACSCGAVFAKESRIEHLAKFCEPQEKCKLCDLFIVSGAVPAIETENDGDCYSCNYCPICGYKAEVSNGTNPQV